MIYASGVFLGSFTPGRLGDLGKAEYLRREYRLSWESALSTAIADRIFDLFLMALLGIWAIWWFGVWDLVSGLWAPVPAGWIMLLTGAIIALILLCWHMWTRGSGSSSPTSAAAGWFHRFGTASGLLDGQIIMRGAALTATAYGLYFGQTLILADIIGFPLSSLDTVAAITLVGLAAFLPISVAGLGTREAILALLLAERAVPNSLEVALLYSGLFFFFFFVVPGLLGGVCWLKIPPAGESEIDAPVALGATNLVKG